MGTRLLINARMSAAERHNRLAVNAIITCMQAAGEFTEDNYRRRLLDQVIDGAFTYDEALGYFEEVIATGCFDR